MTLREEVAKILDKNRVRLYYDTINSIDLAYQIIALVEGQRCEWTQKPDNDWNTGCGKLMFSEHAMPDGAPFCPCCGRKIEVKDEAD